MSTARALEAMLLALCCYMGAGLVTIWRDATAPPASVRQQQTRHQVDEGAGVDARQVIVERNLFRVSTLLPAAPVVAEPVPEVEELAATRLPLRLLGTAGAFAAIEDQHARKQRVVRAGDALVGAATVLRIERRRIVIQNGAAREELALDDETERAPLQTARSREATANAMRERIQKLSETTFAEQPTGEAPAVSPSETQIAPRIEAGQLTGVQLSAIERGSVFEQLGIREGDTVTQVNGVVATNHQDSIALLRELTESSELQVSVVGADGAPRTLTRSVGN